MAPPRGRRITRLAVWRARILPLLSAAGMALCLEAADAACNGNQGFIGGTDQINESSTNIQYNFSCNIGGTPVLPITWQVQSGQDYASIDSTGRVTPKAVGQNRVVQISANDAAGTFVTKQITIVDNVATLDGAAYGGEAIDIGGQYYLNKGTYQQKYVAVIGGSPSELTNASGLIWSVNTEGGASISGGLLNTNAITENQTLSVSAIYSYTPSGLPHLSKAITVQWPAMRARARLPVDRDITGPSEVDENTVSAGVYSEVLLWSDDTQTPISPSWSDDSPYASIDGNGVLRTFTVTSPQQVILTTTFAIYPTFDDYPDYAGSVARTYTAKPITILDNRKILTSVTIDGPGSVNESSTATYAATAHYDDGSGNPAIGPTWSENSAFASIDGGGVLTTAAVTSNQSVTVSASYTYEGVTRTGTLPVTIVNSQSRLLNLAVDGPATVDENGTAAYTATATFDDGTQAVVPVWSVESAEDSIAANGVLSAAPAVAPRTIVVEASYTHLGVHRQASKTVTVLNSERVPLSLQITGGMNVLVGASSAQFAAMAGFDDGLAAEPVQADWWVTTAAGGEIEPSEVEVGISSSGLLTVAAISSDVDIAVHASYTHGHSSGDQTVTASRYLTLAAAYDGDGRTKRVSVSSLGDQASAGSYSPAVSADGRYVVFASDADDLVAHDSEAVRDVFIHDRYLKQTRRLSVDFIDPSAGGNGASDKPAISADGRFVAFVSQATNLVADDGNLVSDVFVYDRQTGALERVSVGTNGSEADGASDDPAISADGRYVAFSSDAANLIQGDTNGVRDVFVHDRMTVTTQRVSIGVGTINGPSHAPAVSSDGRYVTFVSDATNMVSGDTNGVSDVFVRDRVAGITERVSVASAGTEGNGASQSPAISGDGRYVVFASSASSLVANDSNGVSDVFVRDRQTGTTSRISVDSAGQQGNGASTAPAISADGLSITFVSEAANLIAEDGNGASDIFLHDLQSGTTERMSVAGSAAEADAASEAPAISGNGRYVVFASQATGLVAGDTNGSPDIFLRPRAASLAAARVWIDAASIVPIGQTVTADLYMDFSDDPTLGGGIDVGYDGDALSFISFEADPGLGGDPAFARGPDVLSLELNGLAFGEFDGLAGPLRIGTLRFEPLLLGTTELVVAGNDLPMGGFYSAGTQSAQTVDFVGTAIDISMPFDIVPNILYETFDTGTFSAAWTSIGNQVSVVETTLAHTGDYVMQIPQTSDSQQVSLLRIDGVEGGQTLYITYFVRGAAGNPPGHYGNPDLSAWLVVTARAYGSSNNLLETFFPPNYILPDEAPTSFTPMAQSINLPANTSYVIVEFLGQQEAVHTGAWWVDSIAIDSTEPVFLKATERFAPVITSAPVTEAVAGSLYTYQVVAADDPEDVLTYTLVTSPAGMTINPTTGLVQWTPLAAGTFSVAVRVTDGAGTFDIQLYELVVSSLPSGPGIVTHTMTEDFAGGTGVNTEAMNNGVRLLGDASGRVAYWRMDGDWTDASGGGHHGTAVGGVGFTSAAQMGSHAAEFDGEDDLVTWSSDAFLPSGPGAEMTVAFWINNEVWYESSILMEQWDAADNGSRVWSMETMGSGQLGVRLNNQGGTGEILCDGTHDITSGTWKHVAMVFSDPSDTLKTYVDGELSCELTTGFVLGPDNPSSHFHMGGRKNGSTYTDLYTGLIDEVSIYDWALTAQEIAAIAAGTATSGYASDGIYLSSVLDLGLHAGLTTLEYSATVPTGTSLAVDIRAGDTATPPAWGSPTGDWPSAAVISNVQSGVEDNIAALGTRRYVQYRIRMTSDGSDTPVLDAITLYLTPAPPNGAPVISSMPVTTAHVGQPYSYQVEAEDDPGDTLTYTLIAAPAGMTIDAETGLVEWTPAVTGTFGVTIRVTDSADGFDTQAYELTVSDAPGTVSHTTTADFSAGEHDATEAADDSVRLSSDVSGRVALWHMDDDWTDASGGGHHGTAVGGIGFTGAARIGSHAAEFDGEDDLVTWSSDAFLPSGSGAQMTVAFWLNHEVWYESSILMEQWDAASNGARVWSVETMQDGMLGVRLNGQGTTDEVLCYGTHDSSLGAWNHFALVFDDAANKLTTYMDGELDCELTTNFVLGADGASHFHMGGRKNGSSYTDLYTGFIDEVSVYDRALTAQEVAAMAEGNSGGYAGSGTYLSPVLDLGAHEGLSLLEYGATVPSGTTLAVDIRAGDTATPPVWGSPSGDWPSAAVIPDVQSGVTDNIAGLETRRYVQYRVRMTSDGGATPALEAITVHYLTEP